MTAEPWLVTLAALAASAAGGLILHLAIFASLRRLSTRTESVFDDAVADHCAGPSRFLLPVLAMNFAFPGLDMADRVAAFLGKALVVLLILAVGWFLARLARALEELILSRFDVQVRDNLRARRVHTQVEIFRKVVVAGIGVLVLAAVLTRFERLRDLGTGLLASAGLAGLVVGLAAQRTISNLLAGLQIAFTQPIRIDDVVIVEGEWGRIEEITLTFVVVRIWDRRRLVLPISHFIEKPFQNWTRVSADLLGSVYLYVDYEVEVGAVRSELRRILEESEHWDGEAWALHVTESKEDCVELRAIMSAVDAPTAWELRCEVRERLLRYLREEYPEGLPRHRVELERDGGDPEPAGDPSSVPAGRDLPRALERIDGLLERLESREPVVCLDYDGTLAPIAPRPEEATLEEEMRESLRRLAAACPVAVISGRDRVDVEELVDVGGIVYAGSHGFDITGPGGLRMEHEEAQEALPALDAAEGALREALEPVAGTLLERKRFALAVHYRNVDDEEVDSVVELVEAIAGRHEGLRMTGGKKVLELQPDVDWDKGRALRWLLEALELDGPDVVPFYLGDDLTDEDAFRALPDRGVGILVDAERRDRREDRSTAADYRLRDPREVGRFLEALIDFLARRDDGDGDEDDAAGRGVGQIE